MIKYNILRIAIAKNITKPSNGQKYQTDWWKEDKS